MLLYYFYYITKIYGFVILPDEFGYWTYVAKLQGYDWKELNSLGSYYSYGYSLFLYPIFKFIKDPVLCYRAAVTLNFILLMIAFFLFRYIFYQIGKDKKLATIVAAVAVYFPSVLFYAKTTLVEVVLFFFFTLTSFLIFKFFQTNNFVYLILGIISTVYMHFLHMRSIAIAGALVITLLVYFFRDKKNRFMAIVVLLLGIGLFAAGMVVKTIIQRNNFDNSGSSFFLANNYLGQLLKLKSLFDIHGLKNILISLIGKLLYIGVSSFGLAYIGIVRIVKRIKESLFYLFLLLSVVGMTMVSTIFFYRSDTIDHILYGRYHEMVIPILMGIGIIELSTMDHKWKYYFASIITNLVMAIIVWIWIGKNHISEMRGYMMVGLGDFYNTNNDDFRNLLVYAFIGSFMISLFVFLIKNKKLYTVIAAIELILSVTASIYYTDGFALAAERDLYLTEKIEILRQYNPEREIVYIHDNESTYIDILQFMMREETIKVHSVNDSITEKDIVIIDFQNEYKEHIKEKYNNELEYGHFVLLYN